MVFNYYQNGQIQFLNCKEKKNFSKFELFFFFKKDIVGNFFILLIIVKVQVNMKMMEKNMNVQHVLIILVKKNLPWLKYFH
jgi:hypothetical protein